MPTHAYEPGAFPGKGDVQAWNRAVGIFNHGNELNDSHRYSEAVSKFTEAIAIYPFDAAYWVNRSLALRKIGRLQDAEFDSKKAMELNPDDYHAWIGLANCFDDEGKLGEERVVLGRLLQQNHTIPEHTRERIFEQIRDIDRKLGSPTSVGY